MGVRVQPCTRCGRYIPAGSGVWGKNPNERLCVQCLYYEIMIPKIIAERKKAEEESKA